MHASAVGKEQKGRTPAPFHLTIYSYFDNDACKPRIKTRHYITQISSINNQISRLNCVFYS